MIYGYSKLCLTQLVSVAELKPDELIRETITDMFMDNPISGWLASYKYKWSMRDTLKKLLKENNLDLIADLEKRFYPIKSYDVNLLSEKMLALNKFDPKNTTTTGLIISFKNTSVISLTSGIKFYNDEYGFNEIEHIYTAKAERSELPPIAFN